MAAFRLTMKESPARRPLAALALAVLSAAGCAEPPAADEPKPFDEVVVDSVDDGEFTTVFDEIGPRPVKGISGLLPPDVPRELPLYTPAGLIDFGAGARGRFLVLQADAPPDEVRDEQLSRLRRGGWRVSPEGAGWRLDRSGRTVRLTLQAVETVTQLRFDY